MENLGKLAEALAKAQSEITHADANSFNPHFKSKYANLASVWQAIRKPLSSNGLAVAQGLQNDGAHTYLETTLLHSSGESIKSKYPILLAKDQIENPQKLGGAVSYARRYALAAMVGIAQMEEDDGNSLTTESKSNDSRAQGSGPVVNHAPGASNAGALASYRITFGKYKNKSFDEVGPNQIADYCTYLEGKAKQDGKPMKGQVAEFIKLADEYLAGCTRDNPPPFDASEEMPF